ncbi:MAG: DUF389 domain-containing protein, partial [Anaerolineae bacterium]
MDSQTPALPPFHILVAIGGKDHFWPLLSLGYALAKSKQGRLTVLSISRTGQPADWLRVPSAYADLDIQIKIIPSDSPAKAILAYARKHPPELLIVGWRRRKTGGSYLTGGTLDTILRQAPCDVAVVRAAPTWPDVDFARAEKTTVLIPASGGPNAPLAMELALGLSAQTEVTALYIVPQYADAADFLEHQKTMAELTRPWAGDPRLKIKTVRAPSVLKGILAEAETADLTMLGATKESIFNQVFFGLLPKNVALQNPNATIIVKQFDGSVGTALGRLWWKMTHLMPALPIEERTDVYKQVRRGSRPKIDFFMMIGLAAGIAALGLMLNSPAVIIGAMLVAPLMAAIMGLGLGVIQADVKLLRLAAGATGRGMLLAIAVGVVAGALLPNRDPTPEILSRTAPALLDLGVALVSGLAGAYALCRKDVSASLPGVAIAAALVPPLATVGIGLARLRWDIAGGALLLFLTNLVAIVAAGALIFFLLGFRPELTKQGRSRVFKRGIISSALLLAALAWVLTSLTVASFRQTSLEQTINRVLRAEVARMPGQVALDRWQQLETDDGSLKLEVQVRSPGTPNHQSVVELQDRVAAALQLERPIALRLINIRTTELDPIIPPTPTDTAT